MQAFLEFNYPPEYLPSDKRKEVQESISLNENYMLEMDDDFKRMLMVEFLFGFFSLIKEKSSKE